MCPPAHTRPLRVFLPAILLTIALTASCEGDSAPIRDDCPLQCPCVEQGCPQGICGARIELDPSCAETEPRAEVVVDGCLEPEDVTLESPRVTCGFLFAGETGTVVARGEAVQWGPFEFTCPEEGGLLFPVTLECPPKP